MIEKILIYERDVFFALNGSDSTFWDRFMWLFSGKVVWLPLAVLVVLVLVYKKNWRESLLVLLAIALVILLCDQFASGICKPFFTRFRPTHHPDFMNEVDTVFGYRGGRYGFISSHAANAFGFATFMVCLMRDKLFGWTIILFAFLMSYTRIYLGVHFISDVVPGAISGVFFGYWVYRLYIFTRSKLPFGGEDGRDLLYSKKRINLIICGIYATILVILLFNKPLAVYLHN